MISAEPNSNAFNLWVFERLKDYTNRIEVYCGGAGSGKSYGAMQKIILKATNDVRRVLVVRKVGATLRNSVFTLAKGILRDGALKQGFRLDKTNMEIELTNGSVFLFKGCDDSEKIKSIDGITDIVCEEATEFNEDEFTQLNLRLRSNAPYPQIYLMFNPVSKANWVYRCFFENPLKDSLVMRTNYRDNKFLPDSYAKTLEELKYRNPAYYRIYALGEFATLDRLVFPVWTKRIVPESEVAEYPMFAGLDFGYTNDPTALIWGKYDKKQKRVFITGEIFRKGLLNPEIAGLIENAGLKKEIIVADSARTDSIDELKRLYDIRRLRPSRKGPDSILSGIQFIQQHEIVVDERLKGIIEELENYTWVRDKRTGEYINEPRDSFNHGLDALRYALEAFRDEKSARLISKNKYGGVL